MTIWEFNQALTRWLVRWNLPNIALGGLLSTRPDPLLRGIGSQHIGWGLINLGIALFGGRATARRRETLPDPDAPDILAKEARNLRRLLLINAGLDVLYVLGGWRLARTRGATDARARGMGFGIMIQGALLFVWDVWLARRVPKDGRG
jgi:hypothetical protein